MRIKGLDPAGPLFTFPVIAPPKNRLTSTDADFVQVIHTAAKSLGAQICLGDADFWANGGELQPICHNFNLDGTPLGQATGMNVLSDVLALNGESYIQQVLCFAVIIRQSSTFGMH